MEQHVIDGQVLDAGALVALAASGGRFAYGPAALQRLEADRAVVLAHLDAGAPVYGLNTALGGNLGYRLDDAEVVAFQRQLIEGRMIGMGEPLPQLVVRAALLVRCLGLSRGGSGVSVAAAQGLLALLEQGITPVVPMHGSISAGDLGLCAHLVAPLLGLGEAFHQGRRCSGAQALAAAALAPLALQAKDGLGLINTSAVTAGHAAVVSRTLASTLLVAAAVAALADEGYAANLSVFDPRIARARPAGAQQGAAALFCALLDGSALHARAPRAIQDAVSFRTMAQLFGSSYAALALLDDAVHCEINGSSDSPLVFAAQGDMLSSPNFHTAMLALAFDAMAIALVHLAAASVQRIIKLQTASLSGLPKYLSPVGGASVGFNALQKTAAALFAEIRLDATPASLDAVVVSDTVEDHAPNALLCVRKLAGQIERWRSLLAIEALVAAQAVDLRGSTGALGAGAAIVHASVRAVVAPLQQDRPSGPDAERVRAALFAEEPYQALHALAAPLATGLRL